MRMKSQEVRGSEGRPHLEPSFDTAESELHEFSRIICMHEVDTYLNDIRYERLGFVAKNSLMLRGGGGGGVSKRRGVSICGSRRSDTTLTGGLTAQQLHPQLPRLVQDTEHALFDDCAAVGHGLWRAAPPAGWREGGSERREQRRRMSLKAAFVDGTQQMMRGAYGTSLRSPKLVSKTSSNRMSPCSPKDICSITSRSSHPSATAYSSSSEYSSRSG